MLKLLCIKTTSLNVLTPDTQKKKPKGAVPPNNNCTKCFLSQIEQTEVQRASQECEEPSGETSLVVENQYGF